MTPIAVQTVILAVHLAATSLPAALPQQQATQPTSRSSGAKEAGSRTPATGSAAEELWWPQFRGPHASGVADGYETPTSWDVETGKNIVWRTPIPGLAHSSPVIWGDRILVTTAVRKARGKAELKVGLYGSIRSVKDDSEHRFQLLCIDRKNGKILWTRTCWEGVPRISRHPKGSYAAPTPATDGKRVAAFFGTEGLYVYDLDGGLVWKKEFGVLDSGYFRVPSAQWGFGSSPVIHDDRIFVQCDVQKDSFVASLCARTGDVLWRTPRDEVPTWSTPTVHVTDHRQQLILNGYKHIGGYDLDTGKEIWKLRGGGDIPVPTPVATEDTVFITNAHGRMAPIVAISTAATGELSLDPDECKHIRWFNRRDGNYMQTPIVYRGKLYCCRDHGILGCFDIETGERHYRKRLGDGGSGFTASGIAANGKLYFPSEIGEVHIVKAGPEFCPLGVVPLGETCMASPAVCAGTLYFRTRSHLVAIATDV